MDQEPAARAEMVVALSSVSGRERNRLIRVLGSLGVLSRTPVSLDSSSHAERATHLICGQPRRTLKVLFALARGAWIVGPEWVDASVAQSAWADPSGYELAAIPGARRARCSAPRGQLLRGLSMALLGQSVTPLDDLADLLRALGATVHSEPAGAMVLVEGDGEDLLGDLHRQDVAIISAAVPAKPCQVRIRETALLSAIESFLLPPALARVQEARVRVALESQSAEGTNKFAAAHASVLPSLEVSKSSAVVGAFTSQPDDLDGSAPAQPPDVAPPPPAPLPPRPPPQALPCPAALASTAPAWVAAASQSLLRCIVAAGAAGTTDAGDAPAAHAGPASVRAPRRSGQKAAPAPERLARPRSRSSLGSKRDASARAHALECGSWDVGGELKLHVIAGRGEQFSEYFVSDSVLSLYRTRLRECSVDLHETNGSPHAHAADARRVCAAGEGAAAAGSRRGGPTSASKGKKRKLPADFLGDLVSGPLVTHSAAGLASERVTVALTSQSKANESRPMAALTMHIHAGCGVAEILLCATSRQRTLSGFGRAIVECTLHALKSAPTVHTVVCLASQCSRGFWSKMGFREAQLSTEVWHALFNPFDDSVVLQLEPAVLESGSTVGC